MTFRFSSLSSHILLYIICLNFFLSKAQKEQSAIIIIIYIYIYIYIYKYIYYYYILYALIVADLTPPYSNANSPKLSPGPYVFIIFSFIIISTNPYYITKYDDA